jgi:hypothetical protein
MAMDVVIGYGFLWQSSKTDEKLPVTRKWVNEMVIRSKANLEAITAADTTTLTHFAHITGQPQHIGT